MSGEHAPEALLAEMSQQLGGVTVARADGATEYSRDGKPFAVVASEGIDLCLGAEIAEAARRTPNTTASDRGTDWVRFAPIEWDKHATDRLEAWFRVAWRAAAKASRAG